MARVNVEETVYALIPIVQDGTGLKYTEVLGHLVLLWHFSQEKLLVTGTGDQICKWARITKDRETFIAALLDAEFLRHADGMPNGIPNGIRGALDGMYFICGNEKHVKKLSHLRKMASVAAEKRWEKQKRDAISMPNGMQHDADGMPNHAEGMPNTIQYNTIHNINTRRKSRKKTFAYTTEFEELWAAYGKEGSKSDAFHAFEANELNEEGRAELKTAIENYLDECKRKDRTIRHFSTFLNGDWRQHLESTNPFKTLSRQELIDRGFILEEGSLA
jgi:hypothetical protein